MSNRAKPRVKNHTDNVLAFLQTAPHEKANRPPEVKARMLALIGAGGRGMPRDLSENLDEYLYGSKE